MIDERTERFTRLVMPHVDAAYRLARWLTRDMAAAEDVVQEAATRAWRFLPALRAPDGRAWLLAIVRRAALDWRARQRGFASLTGEDGADLELEPADPTFPGPSADRGPEAHLLARAEAGQVQAALGDLPEAHRVILLLREVEDMSYAEIAETLALPPGTVMSRLNRARAALRAALIRRQDAEARS